MDGVSLPPPLYGRRSGARSTFDAHAWPFFDDIARGAWRFYAEVDAGGGRRFGFI